MTSSRPNSSAEMSCRKAREAFEQVVDDRPHLTPEKLTTAVRHVIEFRDALIAERRAGVFDARRQSLLDRTNSLLSLSTSAEFPLVGVRWERITAVRDAVNALADDECQTRGC